jgi:DNA-binding MarR family transcriptional regulator
MKRIDPDAAVCAAQLRRTVSRLHRKLRPGTRQTGLSMAKLSAVAQVHRAGRMTPTDLAAREGVKPQSLTRLLAELEREGWLLRRADVDDGRRTWLSLTRQGRQRLRDAAESSDAALTDTLRALFDVAELDLLLRACMLLDRLDEAIDREPAMNPRMAERAP